jgi:large subunit ribosomal protein L31
MAKKDIHPTLHPVCFVDVSTGEKFITRSTMRTKQTEVINGKDHFVVLCDVTASSHPVCTGQKRFVDTGGRIGKFEARFGRKRSN